MFRSPEHKGFISRVSKALAVAFGVLALASCSNPDTRASTPPAVTVEVEPQATLKNLDPAKSFGKIIFAASQKVGAQHDIYEKDLHTGEVTNLTDSETDELNPQLSPDGDGIVFAGENPDGNYQIFSMDLAGRNIKQLTNHIANDYDPTYTPDGKILYKSNGDDGHGDVWMMNDNGTNPTNLTPDMSNTEEWKPTAVGGYRIVFTSRHADDGSMTREELAKTDELWLLDTSKKGSKPERLTNNSWPDWYAEADPARSGVIAYTSKVTPEGSDTIYEMNITQPNPDKNRKQLTDPNVLPGDSSDCSWAPSGMVLFVNTASGIYGAYVRTTDNTYVKLAQTGGDVLSPIAVNGITVG